MDRREVDKDNEEIVVDLEIPAIPYQVEHVRRMSSSDEEPICDVTRNEVIEYLGEFKLDLPFSCLIYCIESFLPRLYRREYGCEYSKLARRGQHSNGHRGRRKNGRLGIYFYQR